ncbi:hypothetical protein B0H19DRAFT_1061982 [Mycena capillaripes]|nr:hypothetical protein B0H19DRAFT_1061982 [Mycena capillaripes]
MASPPVPDINALTTAFEHIRPLPGYSNLAVVEELHPGLTFDLEVEHIWKQKWGAFTFLWVLLRYIPPLMEIVVLDALFDTSWTPKVLFLFSADTAVTYISLNRSCLLTREFSCAGWLPFAGTYSLICVTLVQCVFALRMYALFGARRSFLIAFMIFFAAEITFMAFFINHTTLLPDPPGVAGCAGGGAFGSRGAAAFWAPSLIFDVVVFAMTIYKTTQTLKENRSLGLLHTILRDGSLYFTIVVFINLANMLTLLLAPLDLASIHANLATALPVVITNRLVLNLKASRADPSSSYAPASGYNSTSGYINQTYDRSATLWSFNAVVNVLGARSGRSDYEEPSTGTISSGGYELKSVKQQQASHA